ncbi:antiterminator LoaP [Roseburia hominis]
MWYVVQVRTGTEENIRKQCLKNVNSDVLKRCFIPYYEEKKRIRGEWTVNQKVLFPGYVFVVTEQLEEMYQQLEKVIGLTKLIGTGDEIVPLREEEIGFLRDVGGDEQVVRMSEGIIEGEQIIVKEGPLMGLEGCIRKIDRHKRKAYLEVEMFGRKQKIEVGLEIVEKRE